MSDTETVNGLVEEVTTYVVQLQAENAKLREDLEFERSENGWAREFLNRMGQKCGTKDCPSLVAYVTKLEAENVKLRELLQRLLTEYRYMRVRPRRVYLQHEERMRAIEEEMRELGVEVE